MHVYVQDRLTRRWNFACVNGHRVLVARWSSLCDNKAEAIVEQDTFFRSSPLANAL